VVTRDLLWWLTFAAAVAQLVLGVALITVALSHGAPTENGVLCLLGGIVTSRLCRLIDRGVL
jgi:hypothetical protein